MSEKIMYANMRMHPMTMAAAIPLDGSKSYLVEVAPYVSRMAPNTPVTKEIKVT